MDILEFLISLGIGCAIVFGALGIHYLELNDFKRLLRLA